MAKKRKSSQLEDTPETTEDNTVEESSATEESPVEDPTPTEKEPDEPVAGDAEVSSDDSLSEAHEPAPEPVSETPPSEPEPAPVQHQHADSASNSVFLPAILGGLIAAGIGFGVAYSFIPRADPDLNVTVAENEYALEKLRDEMAAISVSPEPVDLTPITAEIGTLQDQLASEIDTLAERIASFDERLIALEKQPSSDGTLQESALQAYQRELDDLRAQVEVQAGEALAQLESTRAEAEAIEQAAVQAAEAAQIRAALAQIQTAIETGAPMEAALTDLQDAMSDPIPDALSAVAEGAPTLAKLQADFPNAARAALADARAGGTSGEQTSAFGSFLREQLNVRSVAPREGDDADAILSRAQAAVSAGQLQIALDEIANLADAAKAQLSEWTAVAETRVAAVSAANDISLSLNVN